MQAQVSAMLLPASETGGLLSGVQHKGRIAKLSGPHRVFKCASMWPCSPRPPLCGRVSLRGPLQRHGDEQSGPDGHPRLCSRVQQGATAPESGGRAALGRRAVRSGRRLLPHNLAAFASRAPSHPTVAFPVQVYNDCKLLAIADEEGFVSIVDTSAELPTEMADDWGPNKPRAQWLAHRNAVFDIAWCNVRMRLPACLPACLAVLAVACGQTLWQAHAGLVTAVGSCASARCPSRRPLPPTASTGLTSPGCAGPPACLPCLPTGAGRQSDADRLWRPDDLPVGHRPRRPAGLLPRAQRQRQNRGAKPRRPLHLCLWCGSARRATG